jgi:L-amino acid N-acyltransferase YncA
MGMTRAKKNILIRDATEEDREDVIGIFNYYVENGFAAYPEQAVPPGFFSLLAHDAISFIAADNGEGVIGFAILRPFLPFPVFDRTALVTYYVADGHTGQGTGTLLLNRLVRNAQSRGIRVLLANISSRNPGSLAFHRAHGFREVGRFEGAAIKKGQNFDLVWMQRDIGEE